MIPEEFETIAYEEVGPVGWITLNRPEVLNAFNSTMLRELAFLYDELRLRDEVRCVVLTGAGDRAFCTGVDRNEVNSDSEDTIIESWPPSPFMYRDVGEWIGPKTKGLWKPMIAAINGMACGGAFYFLGEVDFIIASENATFFDPHVSYGITAAYEPMQMLHKMPFQEIMRLTLLGNRERMSAARAFQVGLVSEVVPPEELRERVQWAAEAISAAPPLAIQASVRALWTARELSRSQALSLGYAFVGLGNQRENNDEGQELFNSGKRVEWRLR
jgi:enoyl-CoA hydratase/carnithine racemase